MDNNGYGSHYYFQFFFSTILIILAAQRIRVALFVLCESMFGTTALDFDLMFFFFHFTFFRSSDCADCGAGVYRHANHMNVPTTDRKS